MSETWTHPGLGGFVWGDDAWVRAEAAAASAVWTAVAGLVGLEPVVELALPGVQGGDGPDARDVAALEAFVADAPARVDAALAALLDDFHGRLDPEGGVWWSGALPDAPDAGCGEELPATREGLVAQLTLRRCEVRGMGCDAFEFINPFTKKMVRREATPGFRAVALCFRAEFEEEHGVEVLLDGARVAGLGYALDAQPFEGYVPGGG